MKHMTLICLVYLPGVIAAAAILLKDANSDSEQLLYENTEREDSAAPITSANVRDSDSVSTTKDQLFVHVRNLSMGEEKDNRITVRAKEASLKEVLEEIGRKLGIEVQAQLSPQETVTVEFNDLPLKDALKKLSRRYVYHTFSNHEGSKITKIWILPEGRAATPTDSTKAVSGKPSQPDPFMFELDPTEFVEQAQ